MASEGTRSRTDGTRARVAHALGLTPTARLWRSPRWAVVIITCGLAMVGGGVLSLAVGGPWLNAMSVPLGVAFGLQGVSDFLLGRSPRAVVALRALSAVALLCVVAGWALAAVSGSGVAALAIVGGFGIAAIAYAVNKADARHQS